MKNLLTILLALVCLTAHAQRTPRVVDSIAALIALTPSASAPDVVVVSTNANTRIQFRYYPGSATATNTTTPFVFGTSTASGRWKEVTATGTASSMTLVGDITLPDLDAGFALGLSTNGVVSVSAASLAELDHLAGVTSNVQEQINAVSVSVTTASSTVITVASDLNDLASLNPGDADVAMRVRVLRAVEDGYILGSGRWYVGVTNSSEPEDYPIVIIPQAGGTRRWFLEGWQP